MRILRGALCAVAVLACATVAQAQNYPTKPVTWIVPFAAGGPTDAMARGIAERVSRELGQTIVIDNSPGAGGTIGAGKAARATADGYTMLVGHMGYMGAAPALYKKLPYDPVKDFAPVFRFPDTPLVLMVRAAHPAKDVNELVDFGRKNPDKLFISNAGPGSSSHLIAALVANSLGIKVSLVPYKGAGPALVDVIGGQVDGMFDQTNTALPQINDKKVRALAVTSRSRLPRLKDVPTLSETVLPNFEAATWYGIYAPKGTPKPILDKVQQAYLKVMADKQFTWKTTRSLPQACCWPTCRPRQPRSCHAIPPCPPSAWDDWRSTRHFRAEAWAQPCWPTRWNAQRVPRLHALVVDAKDERAGAMPPLHLRSAP